MNKFHHKMIFLFIIQSLSIFSYAENSDIEIRAFFSFQEERMNNLHVISNKIELGDDGIYRGAQWIFSKYNDRLFVQRSDFFNTESSEDIFTMENCGIRNSLIFDGNDTFFYQEHYLNKSSGEPYTLDKLSDEDVIINEFKNISNMKVQGSYPKSQGAAEIHPGYSEKNMIDPLIYYDYLLAIGHSFGYLGKKTWKEALLSGQIDDFEIQKSIIRIGGQYKGYQYLLYVDKEKDYLIKNYEIRGFKNEIFFSLQVDQYILVDDIYFPSKFTYRLADSNETKITLIDISRNKIDDVEYSPKMIFPENIIGYDFRNDKSFIFKSGQISDSKNDEITPEERIKDTAAKTIDDLLNNDLLIKEARNVIADDENEHKEEYRNSSINKEASAGKNKSSDSSNSKRRNFGNFLFYKIASWIFGLVFLVFAIWGYHRIRKYGKGK